MCINPFIFAMLSSHLTFVRVHHGYAVACIGEPKHCLSILSFIVRASAAAIPGEGSPMHIFRQHVLEADCALPSLWPFDHPMSNRTLDAYNVHSLYPFKCLPHPCIFGEAASLSAGGLSGG